MNLLKKRIVIPVIFSVLGLILLLVAVSKYGLGVTHDSAAYIYAAQSFLEGKGYVYFGYNTPFVQWPPLYSSLIAFGSIWGIDFMDWVTYLNLIVFGLLIFLSSLWLFKNLKNHFIALLGSVNIVFSIALLRVFIYAWSESVFILFIILFLFMLQRYLADRKFSFLILAALFSSAACMTRYIGTACVFAGVLVLFFQCNKRIKDKIKDVLVFGFISSVPLALWLLRNYFAFSTLAGSRQPSHYTFMYNTVLAVKTIIRWFFPNNKVFVILPGVIILVFLVFLLKNALKSRKNKENLFIAAFDKNRKGIPILPMIVFSVVYTLYLIVSASKAAFDPIGDRLLAPVFIPLVLIIFFIADKLYYYILSFFEKIFYGYILILLMCIWIVYPVSYTSRLTIQCMQHGAGGYSIDYWRNSELMECVNSLPPKCVLYSNFPDAVYTLTGLHANYIPKKNTDVYEYGFERFKQSIGLTKYSYIIWFNRGPVNWIYNIEELGQYFNIEKINSAGDGDIYTIKLSDDT